MFPMKNARFTYFIILLGTAVWCSAVVLAPVFISYPGAFSEFGKLLYSFFHPVCHQVKERSFFIHDMPLGVCSRCTAIYFAFFIGTLIYPAVQSINKAKMPPRWILFLSCIPLVVDGFPYRFGMYETTPATRVITGSIAGFALAFFIVPAAIRGVSEIVADRLTVFHQYKGISNATETR